MFSNLKLKLFSGLVLRAMAREQAEKGARRVCPRHQDVAHRLGLEADSPELEDAERYLTLEGYITPSNHSDGSFTITEVGWEDLGYQRSGQGWRRRPWWRRLLGV